MQLSLLPLGMLVSSDTAVYLAQLPVLIQLPLLALGMIAPAMLLYTLPSCLS